MKKTEKLYVVVTIDTLISSDTNTISDIIGVYKHKRRAEEILQKIKKKEPIRGLDYKNLIEYNDVDIIVKNLNETIKNEEVWPGQNDGLSAMVEG